jgi:aminoglycoside phosphotransferase (APT) family kinase protein
MKTQNPIHYTRLTECLEAVLPSNATDVSLHDIHRLTEQGATSVMYSFVLTYISEGLKQQRDFVLRLYKLGSEKNAFKEFSLLKTLKEYNIPVPNAYCFEAENRMLGKPFMIMEKIIGKSASHYLDNEKKAQSIIDKMAKILVRLHKLDPNCIQNSNVLQHQYELRQQRLLKIRFFINKRCMNFLGFCPLRQRRFIKAVKRLKEVKSKKFRPTLLHLDYEPDHVLVSNGEFIIVDWGEASIGDPAFDVAWTYHKLRLGREMAKVDLGEHFVKSYEKYMGHRLVNLQFCKDMVAIEIALLFVLSPFRVGASQLRNYAKLVDLTFGNIFGQLLGAKELHRMERLMALHHNRVYSDIEYIQSYATRYLERDRYSTRN